MKVQCDVCERAEATVVCGADEAALCNRCDEKVHAANKLAGKHQRVSILSQSSSRCPSCDICQERAGYFFCLEDRAVLCGQCDDAVHVASSHASTHQRYLITGTRLALRPASCNGSGTSDSSPEKKRMRAAAPAAPQRGVPSEDSRCPWEDILAAGDLDQLYLRLASEPGSSTADSR